MTASRVSDDRPATLRRPAPTGRERDSFVALVRGRVPGLLLLIGVATAATAVAMTSQSLSPLTLSILLAAVVANIVKVPDGCDAGIAFGSRTLLRVGVVLLGLRLSVSDVASLGGTGLLGVIVVVLVTFCGAQLIARWLGLTPNLGLLLATGYAICGASAIAAINGVVEADEEETAYTIAMVTLCGSLSILLLPMANDLLQLNPVQFGNWVGGSVHDVGQVIATASSSGPDALAAATLVKLTRVVMLAPVVAAVSLWRRKTAGVVGQRGNRPPLIPLFVIGFLGAVLLRSSGILSGHLIAVGADLEKLTLTLALAGLGFGVRLRKLRVLGRKPLLLGVLAWILVAGVAYVETLAVGLQR